MRFSLEQHLSLSPERQRLNILFSSPQYPNKESQSNYLLSPNHAKQSPYFCLLANAAPGIAIQYLKHIKSQKNQDELTRFKKMLSTVGYNELLKASIRYPELFDLLMGINYTKAKSKFAGIKFINNRMSEIPLFIYALSSPQSINYLIAILKNSALKHEHKSFVLLLNEEIECELNKNKLRQLVLTYANTEEDSQNLFQQWQAIAKFCQPYKNLNNFFMITKQYLEKHPSWFKNQYQRPHQHIQPTRKRRHDEQSSKDSQQAPTATGAGLAPARNTKTNPPTDQRIKQAKTSDDQARNVRVKHQPPPPRKAKRLSIYYI